MTPGLQRAIFWGAFAMGLARAAWLMAHSPGAPLDDEIAHFLIARDVWAHPVLALDLWGRSLNTLIYAIPAAFGLPAARIFSLVLTSFAAGITYLLARHLAIRHAWLVPLLFWFQPWVLELSFTCLTEIPFLLFLVGGLYCAVTRREVAAGLLLGGLALIRHEGLAIVVAGLAYATLARRPRLAWTLVVPYAAFAVLYWAILGQGPFGLFADVRPTTAHGSGGWLHFAPLLLGGGGGVALIAIYGLPRLLRSNAGALIVAVNLLYLIVHVVIFKFGLFASGGYMHFLFPLAALLALAAAAGIDHCALEVGRARLSLPWGMPMPTRLLRIAVITLSGAAIALIGWRLALPHPLRPLEQACLDAAEWVEEHGLAQRTIVASNAWFHYGLGLPVAGSPRPGVADGSLSELPAGAIVAWDRKYSDDWGLPVVALRSDPQWRVIGTFGPAEDVVLFEKK